MYSTHVELLKDNGKTILYIYQIMMITGVLIAMYPIWPPRIKKEIIVQTWWNIAIFYMLIFFSSFFVMVSNFGQLQSNVFFINMLIAAILVGWRIGLGMIFIGFYLSLLFYKFHTGVGEIDGSIGAPQFIFIYALMVAGAALIIFFKPQLDHQALTEEKNEHLSGRIGLQEKEIQKAMSLKSEFIRNITHEYHAPMTGISSMAQILSESYDKLDDKQRRTAIDAILKSSVRLEVFDANISSLAALAKADYKLQLEPINFSDLLYERIEICRKLYEENTEDREFIFDIEEDVIVNGDKRYLSQLLDNLLINAITYCTKGKITASLKHTKAGVECVIEDEGIGIPCDELKDIFAEFTVSSKTHSFAGNRGVGLAVCKRIMEVHEGSIQAESNGEKGASFSFSFMKKIA